MVESFLQPLDKIQAGLKPLESLLDFMCVYSKDASLQVDVCKAIMELAADGKQYHPSSEKEKRCFEMRSSF